VWTVAYAMFKRSLHFDMMSHVISTLRWLPDPLSMHVEALSPPPRYVIKFHCFLKKLPPLIVHVLHFL